VRMPDVLNTRELFWVLFCDQTLGAVISACIKTLESPHLVSQDWEKMLHQKQLKSWKDKCQWHEILL
jgi:hypothetical protein